MKPTQRKPYQFKADDYDVDLPSPEMLMRRVMEKFEKFSEHTGQAASKAIANALEDFRNCIDVTIHGADNADMKITLWDEDAIEEVMTLQLMDLINEYAEHEEIDDDTVLRGRADHLATVADRIRSVAEAIRSRADAAPKVISAAAPPEPAPTKSNPN